MARGIHAPKVMPALHVAQLGIRTISLCVAVVCSALWIHCAVHPDSVAAHAHTPFGLQGEPKAIPWTHTTPLRCAVDGWSLQDIKPGNVVCWPTNLGWMMGPWLVFASLLNGASIALYQVPHHLSLCRFLCELQSELSVQESAGD